MLLGQLMDRLTDETFAVETVVSLGDLGLLLRIEKIAADDNLRFGEAITRSIHRFSANANADQWMQLMGIINRAEDPGAAALKQMLDATLPAGGTITS